MKKIVITGGPCSGKTSVIEELKARGYVCLDETAKKIVTKRREIFLDKKESDIRQKMIFEGQLEKERKVESLDVDYVFLDRSLIDGLGYTLLYSGEGAMQKFLPETKKQKYDFIFNLELLPFSSEGFRASGEDEGEARRIENAILETYKMFGYETIFIQKMPIEERVDFILKKVLD